MANDYDALYKTGKQLLGQPTAQFVEFFNKQTRPALTVLDVGCGQGRDALFIAQLGHQVTAVDISPTGIADLLAEAAAENLAVNAYVTDIQTFIPAQHYDVIVVDRVLHMLPEASRGPVLATLCQVVNPHGAVLIADERKNLSIFDTVFANAAETWTPMLKKGGFLFMQRAG